MTPRLGIAESDKSLAENYVHFFWKQGFDVNVAGDDLACVKLLCECPPRPLIVEHDLPWDGAEGVHQIINTLIVQEERIVGS